MIRMAYNPITGSTGTHTLCLRVFSSSRIRPQQWHHSFAFSSARFHDVPYRRASQSPTSFSVVKTKLKIAPQIILKHLPANVNSIISDLPDFAKRCCCARKGSCPLVLKVKQTKRWKYSRKGCRIITKHKRRLGDYLGMSQPEHCLFCLYYL